MSARLTTDGFDVEQVVRASLRMLATGCPEALELATDDVELRGPMADLRGREQLRTHLSDWQDGLTEVEVVIDRMAIDGPTAVVSWHFDARHTGVVFLMEDVLFDPTGNQVTVHLTSEIGFRGRRVCSFRNDYDLDDLMEQLRPDPG